MVGGEFDRSAAVREINSELQTAKRSRPTPNWDEITRAICGLDTPLPVLTAHIDADLNPAKAITEKNLVALRNPCNLLTMPHADSALRELSSFATGAHLCNTPRALARKRCSERAIVTRTMAAGPSHGSGSQAPVHRQGGAAGHGQIGLVYQVAGTGSS